MTYHKWALLYKAYKNNFDKEMMMKLNGTRYEDLEKEITIDDVIPL